MKTPYTEIFASLAPGYDPRHIEAYVRLEYGTLNHLSLEKLKRETAIAIDCIRVGGLHNAEACARSFGL